MVITISPTHSSSSSHTGTLPAGESKGRSQGQRPHSLTNRTLNQFPSRRGQMATNKQPILQGANFCYSKKRLGGTLTPMTHAVRATGAAGNDYPQPQRTGQSRGTQGALDHDPSQVERPHPSPQCHGPLSHSRGAGDRRRTSEGRPSWAHFFPSAPRRLSLYRVSHIPSCTLRVVAGLESPPQKGLRAVPTSIHYLERESYVDGNRASDCAQA